MKRAKVFVNKDEAGILEEIEKSRSYRFFYHLNYKGSPVSLTMPIQKQEFHFNRFPPFFDGLLPEGVQLEGLLKQRKIDKDDHFEQLLAVGADLVGSVSVQAVDDE